MPDKDPAVVKCGRKGCGHGEHEHTPAAPPLHGRKCTHEDCACPDFTTKSDK